MIFSKTSKSTLLITMSSVPSKLSWNFFSNFLDTAERMILWTGMQPITCLVVSLASQKFDLEKLGPKFRLCLIVNMSERKYWLSGCYFAQEVKQFRSLTWQI